MQKISSARIFVICAILKSKKAVTGYDMSMHYALSHQAAYRECKNLFAQGLLNKTKEPQEGKPDKNLYTVRDRKLLKQTLLDELSKSRKASAIRLQDIDAALAAIDIVGKQVIIEWLNSIVKENKKALNQKGNKLQIAYRKKVVEFASDVLDMVCGEFEKDPMPA